jgi:hypothetical protein
MNHAAHLTPEQAIHMALVAPEPEPFDQSLYDAVMAVSPYAWDDEHPFDPEWLREAEGYLQAARKAARIVAERATGPVVPEGWRLTHLHWNGTAGYAATLEQVGYRQAVFGYGATWQEALSAAIAEARS